MNIMQLMVQIGIKGAEIVTEALGHVEHQTEKTGTSVKKTGHAVHEAEEEFKHFKLPVMEAVVAMQSVSGAAREVMEMVGEFSGLKAASEWRHLQTGLENVTGSAEKARDMLKELQEIGGDTPFNSQQLASYASSLVNAGAPAEQVPVEVKTLANLASSGAMDPSQMPEFMTMMVKMRNMNEASGRMLESVNGLDIKKFVNAGAGTHFKTANQAYDFLGAVPGREAYHVLLKGADALAKDAAAMALVRDPALALAKTLETLEEAMAPTGALLLKVLTPVGAAMGWLAKQLEHLNNVTGGAAGLIGIVALLVRHHRLLFGSIRAAIRYTDELAESIERYGEAAQLAAHASGAAGAAEVEGVGVAAAAGGAGAERAAAAAGKAGAVAGTAATAGLIARMVAPMRNLSTWLKALGGIARFVKSPTVLSLATAIGGGMIGDHVGGHWGGAIKGASEWGGLGLLGFTRGPLIGAITTAIGAIGGGVYGYRHPDAKDEKSDALEKAADAMNALTFKLVGGGPRTQRSVKTLEVERGLAYALSLGLG